MAEINKELLEHLAKLARLELTGSEEETLLRDLGKILNYFEELQELDTENVPPMTGGTGLKNVFRIDEERDLESEAIDRENVKAAFPETESDFLKVPPVFD